MTLLDDHIYSIKRFIDGEYDAEATSHGIVEANEIMLDFIKESL